MNVIIQNENRLCVELTGDDMERLDITYDELDYSEIHTKCMLWTVLDSAVRNTDTSFSAETGMMIEALPTQDGGCLLFFTAVQDGNGRKQLSKGCREVCICRSDVLDDICRLSKVITSHGGVLTSELYEKDGEYRLIVRHSADCSPYFSDVYREFCHIDNVNAEAVTREHWKLIASPDAAEKLSVLI